MPCGLFNGGFRHDDHLISFGRPRRDADRTDREREQGGPNQFIGALRSVAEGVKAGDRSLKTAPHFTPRRRLDETAAARKRAGARYLAVERIRLSLRVISVDAESAGLARIGYGAQINRDWFRSFAVLSLSRYSRQPTPLRVAEDA